MLATQTGYQLRLFVRSPRAIASASAMPLVLLVLLSAISDQPGLEGAGTLAGGMIALGLLQVCYLHLASALVASRDAGQLKRLRATPLPLAVHLAARVLAAMVLGLGLAGIVGGSAIVAYDARLDADGLVPALVGLLLGSVTLSLVGLAVAQLIPRGDAATAVLTLTMFPAVLISGMFFPVGELPGWVGWLSEALPVSHLLALLWAGFSVGQWDALDVGWLVIWGVGALAFALAAFRVEPGAAVRIRRPASGRRRATAAE